MAQLGSEGLGSLSKILMKLQELLCGVVNRSELFDEVTFDTTFDLVPRRQADETNWSSSRQ